MTELNKPKRGIFLIVMLSYYGLICFGRLTSILVPQLSEKITSGGPSWAYGFNIGYFIISLLSLVGIIFWKKYGIYTYVLLTISAILVDFLAFSPKPGIFLPIQTLFLLGLLVWSVYRKWKYFH